MQKISFRTFEFIIGTLLFIKNFNYISKEASNINSKLELHLNFIFGEDKILEIKSTIGVLFAVLLLISVTATAVSARPDSGG